MSQEAARQETSPFYVKPTFSALSDALTEFASSGAGHLRTKPLQKLKDQLFLSPRLTQWHVVELGFRLFNSGEDVAVTVQPDRVFVTKGIRVLEVMSGLAAATLHKAVSDAQELVSPVIEVPPMSEDEQAEFFADDPSANGADIDVALADSPAGERMPSFDMAEEEVGLVEETLDADQEKQETEPLKKVFDPAILQRNTYATRMNRNSETGATQVNVEYKDREPVADCPRMETTRVVAHLKSLQGQILNIIEASFADKEQRKAVKTLINKTFRSKMNNLGAGWSDDEE
jgi:hypothetical protein